MSLKAMELFAKVTKLYDKRKNMRRVIFLLFIAAATLFITGCDFFKTEKTQVGEVTNFEDHVAFTKTFTQTEGSSTAFALGGNIAYLQVVNGVDSKLFSTIGTKVKLNFTPQYSAPQDANRDNIYETKLYGMDSAKNDFIILVKIEVTKSGDNNNSGGGSDNNTTTGDNNTTNGDNNNTGSGDNNSTQTGDSNDTGNNNGSNSTVLDSDNDYIPDNIEALLGKDSNSSDENADGIADGLEGDKFFGKQWYIRATGTATNPSEIPSVVGNDLNLLDVYKRYMGYNRGNPVILQIVDSGVEIAHEDLKENIDLSRSLNGAQQGDPTPGGYFKPHGTMLAGIAAARAFNGVGIRGVAPFAKIAGSNWLVQQSLDGLDAAWLSGNGANEIAVTNNSWGTYYTIDTFYEDIMKEGVATLRDGKGRVYVFASGNAREENADANIQYVINNRFALVVSALGYDNRVASYSTPGANVWISAYGGDADYDKGPTIATTYLSGEATNTWSEDSAKNYTYAMAGSSAAAPMVTGAVALLLEACPNLGWRDVKYLLAKSAKKVDDENSSWVTNAAGFHFSRDYGFGLISTKGAIDICQDGYNNLGAQKWVEGNVTLSKDIGVQSRVDMDIPNDIQMEWVEATIDIDTQNASDIDIYITSPSGTRVQLIKSGTIVDDAHIPNSDWMSGGFRFSTGAFLDESSQGSWSIEVVNSKNAAATLKSIALKIYGH